MAKHLVVSGFLRSELEEGYLSFEQSEIKVKVSV